MFDHPDDDTPSKRWSTLKSAPEWTELHSKAWRQEASHRLLENNFNHEVEGDSESLVIYGGTGRPAHSWDVYNALSEELLALKDDETLLVQSVKPVGRFRAHERAPRVRIVNANLVEHWNEWHYVRGFEARGR